MFKLFTPFIGGRAGLGILIFRVVTGFALMIHGYPKILHPLSWMDKMGSNVPGVLQGCAALAEFGGGLALVLGLLTPIACLGIFITMLVAILTVHVPQGGAWIGGPHAFESAASYLVSSILLFFTGPGTMSVDAKLFRQSEFVENIHMNTSSRENVGLPV